MTAISPDETPIRDMYFGKFCVGYLGAGNWTLVGTMWIASFLAENQGLLLEQHICIVGYAAGSVFENTVCLGHIALPGVKRQCWDMARLTYKLVSSLRVRDETGVH